MDRRGGWHLAPAFDLIYAYNPSGAWTSRQQMTLNGKRDAFTKDDLLTAASHANLKPTKAKNLLTQVHRAVSTWQTHAAQAGVFENAIPEIQSHLRLDLHP
jgi:serine/threonine-protein kinase HipA